MSSKSTLLAGGMLFAVLALSATGCAAPPPSTPGMSPSPKTSAEERTTGVERIVDQFASIAEQHDGNRAVGTPGGIASGDFIIAELRQMGLDVRIQEFTNTEGASGRNITATLIRGSGDEKVLIGAHYDSVKTGPGIADNASGVAAVLAAASAVDPGSTVSAMTVELAFWDSEEYGLAGSTAYVGAIPETDRAGLSYVNFDMVASLKGEFQIIDGTRESLRALREISPDAAEIANGVESALPPVPEGSAELDAAVRAAFIGKDLRGNFTIGTASDSRPFLMTGIRTSGISVIDPQEESFISCYHAACDDRDNIDRDALAFSVTAIEKLIHGLTGATG